MEQEDIDVRAKREWVPVSDGLPDWDVTVVVALADLEEPEPVWLGYYDDGWHSVDGEEIAVSHWRYMHEHPVAPQFPYAEVEAAQPATPSGSIPF